MTTKDTSAVERIVEEFERRSVDAEYRRHKDTFWFEEGEHLRYDQEAAAKYLRKLLTTFEAEIRGEERERILVALDEDVDLSTPQKISAAETARFDATTERLRKLRALITNNQSEK